MINFYATCVVISILFFLWMFVSDVRKSVAQYAMMFAMILSSLGYLALSLSTTLGEALLSLKLAYIGGCFVPFLYFLTVCEVCKINIRNRIRLPLLVMQICIYALVLTVGYTDWYYTSVELELLNNCAHLLKEYAPLHVLYPISLFGYLFASIVFTFVSFSKKRTVNRSELIRMAISAVLATLCYLLQRVFHFDFDIISASYLFLLFGTIIPIYHANLYMVERNKDIVEEQIDQVAFVTFDTHTRFMGCNLLASEVFPELGSCIVGRRIMNPGADVKSVVAAVQDYDLMLAGKRLRGHVHKEFGPRKIGDRIFETDIHTLNDYLYRRVGYTVELRDMTEHYQAMELKEKYNEQLSREVLLKTERIRTMQENTILGMAQMVESRDLSTGGHIRRTSAVVRIFAKKLLEADLGFTREFLGNVVHAAPMHDLGKIGVDDAILRKQGKFTPEEFEEMKKHSEIGGRMVHDILSGVEEEQFVSVATNVARYHHEKVNGKGYPEGLVGDEIPVEARIMALADVFDALVSPRCYKNAFSYDKAFGIIKEDTGTHFDSVLAEIFLTCRPELEAYYDKENAGVTVNDEE